MPLPVTLFAVAAAPIPSRAAEAYYADGGVTRLLSLSRAVGRYTPLAVGRGGSQQRPFTVYSKDKTIKMEIGEPRTERNTLFKSLTILVPKVHPTKRAWQVAAEQAFLASRAEVPHGYSGAFTAAHLAGMHPWIQAAAHLRVASSNGLSQHRKVSLRQQVGCSVFDRKSLSVQITDTTEKILGMRAHMLKYPRDRNSHRPLSIALGRRHRAMKALYQKDFELYKHVCKVASLKCVRFSIPDSRDPSKAINRTGIDGERARFLIRQRFWRGKFRPLDVELPNGNRIRPIRHALLPVRKSFGWPVKVASEVSKSWPYGVSTERIEGQQTIRNPTAPGALHIPVPIVSYATTP